MLLQYVFAAIVLVSSSSAKAVGNARNVQRLGKSINVNLVEFVIKDVLHGKCSYVDRKGRDVALIYEESRGVMKARSAGARVLDPVVAVRECRSAAMEVPKVEKFEGRSGTAEQSESPLELKARYDQFARANVENRQYVDQIQPRFLSWLGNIGTNIALASGGNNNFGLSFGGDNTDVNPLPGINLMAPNNDNHLTTTVGGSNPFDFLTDNESGPWGVLNSISNNGGFFSNLFGLSGLTGFGGIFGR